MKILQVHNYYGSEAPSGENIVFEAENLLLTNNGHIVETFNYFSDSIRNKGFLGKTIGAASTPFNPVSLFKIQKKINDFKPDIIHVHNTFPLLSPSIFYALNSKAAFVLTLHNYRLQCPAAIPMRDGKVCTKCIDNKSVMHSILFGCYRGSRIATFPLAIKVFLHRILGTWEKKVDAFIALSLFQKNLMIDGGLPREKVFVKPNFYSGNPSTVPFQDRSIDVLFVGRLSREKGILTLIKAWKKWGNHAPNLTIVGEGPLYEIIKEEISGLPIKLTGQLKPKDTEKAISHAKLVVLPSEWFEGFPMVIREAFAYGTAAAVSKIGPLPNIVKSGVSGVNFEPGNPNSLLFELKRIWDQPKILQKMGLEAHNIFQKKYSSKSNYDELLSIYRMATLNKNSLK